MRVFTCAVFGASNAGKTKFIQRVCGTSASTCILNRHDTTETGAHVLSPIQINFGEMHELESPSVHVDFAIIVLDLSQPSALATLPALYSQVDAYADEFLVVAAKSDIQHGSVKYADIKRLCVELGVEWIRISSLTGENVYTPIHILLDYALD